MELDGIGTLCCFWSCNFQTNQKLLESPIATYIAKSNESSILWFFIHNVEGRLQILQSHCGKSCGQFPHFDILTLQSGIGLVRGQETFRVKILKSSVWREKRERRSSNQCYFWPLKVTIVHCDINLCCEWHHSWKAD